MRRVEVFVEIAGEPVLAGDLRVHGVHDRATSDFWYDPGYMYDSDGFDLAPAVRRKDGEITTRGLPLFIQDAGPDRWGAHLVERSFQRANVGRYPDSFDCILAASDLTRQGALRFRDQDGEWLGDDGVPAHVELADLLTAADEVAADTDRFQAYAALLSTGTSALGGARAKASVSGPGGELWIAKFPMAEDGYRNVPLWEKTALELAARVGIQVPPSQLLQVAGRTVLLVERFDRAGSARVPYLSMRTVLNNPDDGSRPPDYRDIAATLRRTTDADLAELYRRVVFGVLVNNTDDHLRNLGILRRQGTWELAPIFDVNPEPMFRKTRHTGIAGRHAQIGVVDGLVELASYCGLPRALAFDEIERQFRLLDGWQEVAAGYGASGREIDRYTRGLGKIHQSVAEQLRSG